MTTRLRLTVLFAVTALSLASAPIGRADPPLIIPYQGQVLTATGAPLNGSVTLGIAFFTAATGGSPTYSETQTNVPVYDGRFDVQIGTGAAAPGSSLANAFNSATGSTWLELTVNGEVQSVRERVVSAPFSLVSGDSTQLAGNSLSSVLSSARGPAGVAGPTGLKGVQGPQGAQGRTPSSSVVCTRVVATGGQFNTCFNPGPCNCGSKTPLLQVPAPCAAFATSGNCSTTSWCSSEATGRPTDFGSCCVCEN
jgi:hypothetical protein